MSPRTVRFASPPKSITLVRDSGEEQARQLRAVEAAREEGRRQGYEESSQSLSRQILEQRTQIANLQENTLLAISGQFGNLVEEVRRALPSLALEVARRALAGIELDAGQVRAIADEVLNEVAPGTLGVKLKLCPHDLGLIQALAREFEQSYPGLELVADSELHSGDCVASTQFGTIDARLVGKLENIAHALL